ncbi:MAG: ATP-binding protein, partial [Desulfobulbaceae bacterium]|nr:ATP-binding protein [Desulfobulbaceae bacterium]
LFSMETLNIEKKGAIFLFDNDNDELTLHAKVNLSEEHPNTILPMSEIDFLKRSSLSKDAIFHPYQPAGKFHNDQPDVEPHGHYYVPIKTNSKIYGVIVLYLDNDLPRNKDDINFFTSIADICAGGLVRLYYSQKILDYQQTLEQKVAAQTIELSREKEHLAVTLRSIGDGVITTDTSGNIVLLNKVAEQLTGWSKEEAAGLPLPEVFKIINKQTGQSCENPVEQILQNGKIINLPQHTVLLSKDGRERNIDDSGAPIRDMESKIIGAVLVFRDITEQLITEQELLKVKKLESVGVLAGGIAHDFNNLLSAILGNLSLSLLAPDLTDETKSLLSEAEKASIRARGLTQQLLTFAKGGEPVKETASIREVIQDSAQFILHGGNVACNFAIPDDLWLADIDKNQISQVIQNIILNASQATPDGGLIQIKCTNIDSPARENAPLPHNKKYIKIEINDNGVGIAADIIERIFDPYFSTKQKGSGLGMTITHSIITQHGGIITVDSRPNVGTTFTIYLPATCQGKTTCTEQPAKPDKGTGKSRIMLMDDEEMVRNVLKEMLTIFGHDVILTADGNEAIKAFKEADPPIDLIIMDLTIPGGMGGKEAVKKILEIDKNAKVIVSSGYSNDPIMANYKDYGFSGAIVKPFEVKELTNIINKVLG